MSLDLSAAELKRMFGLIQSPQVTTQVIVNAVIKEPYFTWAPYINLLFQNWKIVQEGFSNFLFNFPSRVLQMLIKTLG